MHGSRVACVVLRLGCHVPPPSQNEKEKMRKRKEEKKAIRNAQTVPDRPTVVPSVPLVYRVVLFVSNLHADFFTLSLSRSVFVFASWTILPGFDIGSPGHISSHVVL